jgi:hypothetical protein
VTGGPPPPWVTWESMAKGLQQQLVDLQTRHADLEQSALALLDRLDHGRPTIGGKEPGTREHLRSLIPMRAGGPGP